MGVRVIAPRRAVMQSGTCWRRGAATSSSLRSTRIPAPLEAIPERDPALRSRIATDSSSTTPSVRRIGTAAQKSPPDAVCKLAPPRPFGRVDWVTVLVDELDAAGQVGPSPCSSSPGRGTGAGCASGSGVPEPSTPPPTPPAMLFPEQAFHIRNRSLLQRNLPSYDRRVRQRRSAQPALGHQLVHCY